MLIIKILNRSWCFEKKHESTKKGIGYVPAECGRQSYGRWAQTPSDWPCSSRRHPSTSPWGRGCVQSGRPRSPRRRHSRTSVPAEPAAARRTVPGARRSVELAWWAAMTSVAQRWRSCSTSWWCCPELVLLSPVYLRADCLPRSTAPADSSSSNNNCKSVTSHGLDWFGKNLILFTFKCWLRSRLHYIDLLWTLLFCDWLKCWLHSVVSQLTFVAIRD